MLGVNVGRSFTQTRIVCTNGEHECWCGIALLELLIVSQNPHSIKHKSISYFAFIVIIMKLAFSLIPRSVVVIGFLLFFRQGPSVLAASPEDGDNTIGHSILRPVSSKLSLQNDYGAEDSSSAVRAKKDGSPAAPSRGHFLRSPPALRKEEQEERLLKKKTKKESSNDPAFEDLKDAISLISDKKIRKKLKKLLKKLKKEFSKDPNSNKTVKSIDKFASKLDALANNGDISSEIFGHIASALEEVVIGGPASTTSTTSTTTTTSTSTSTSTSSTTTDGSTTPVSTTTNVYTPVSTTSASTTSGGGVTVDPCQGSSLGCALACIVAPGSPACCNSLPSDPSCTNNNNDPCETGPGSDLCCSTNQSDPSCDPCIWSQDNPECCVQSPGTSMCCSLFPSDPSCATSTSTVATGTSTSSSTSTSTTPVSTSTTSSSTTPDVSTTPVSATTTSTNNGEGVIESPCLLVDGGIKGSGCEGIEETEQP